MLTCEVFTYDLRDVLHPAPQAGSVKHIGYSAGRRRHGDLDVVSPDRNQREQLVVRNLNNDVLRALDDRCSFSHGCRREDYNVREDLLSYRHI